MDTVALPLIALSAAEAATVLRRAGFHARVEGDRIVLQRDLRVVVLPAQGLLDGDALRAFLRDAGLDYVALLDRLETPLPAAVEE